MNSLGDCTETWASGGGSSVLALPSVGTAGGVLNGINDHGETALELVQVGKAAEHVGNASTALGAATLLTTGINSWTSPASWGAFTDVGACLKDTIGTAADSQAGMFGVNTTRP